MGSGADMREVSWDAFEAAEVQARLRVLAAMVALTGLSFFPIDWLGFPEYAPALVVPRLFYTSGAIVIYLASRMPRVVRSPALIPLCLFWPSACLAAMTVVMDGFSSPYVMALVMANGLIPVIVPFRWRGYLVGGSLAALVYVGANGVVHGFHGPLPLTNTAFVGISVMVGAVASYGYERVQRLEHASRIRLQEAHDRLREQDRTKTRFFQNISHELRTPLTVLLAPLDEMSAPGAELDPRWRARVEPMRRNAHRLLRLVNQLLDLSKLDEGEGVSRVRAIDLEVELRGLVEQFEPSAEARELALTFAPGENLGALTLDADSFEKIVSNLLSNALKFTPAGGRVEVAAAREEDRIVVTVRDSGIGIAPENHERVFQRFGQVEDVSSRRYEGTGIGLPLARALAERAGGALDLVSAPGEGSTFTLRLPLAPPEPPVEAALESGEMGSTIGAHAAAALDAESGAAAEALDTASDERWSATDGPPRALVVEDNRDMQALLVRLLGARYRVRAASNGVEALARLAEEPLPDVIVSDVMMPEMDGEELLARLRADPRTAGLPFLMLTARAGVEGVEAGLAAGADDYVSKPFDTRELMARTASVLRAKEQERELRALNITLERRVVAQAIEHERLRAERIEASSAPAETWVAGPHVTLIAAELIGVAEIVGSVDADEVCALVSSFVRSAGDVARSRRAHVESAGGAVMLAALDAPEATEAARAGIALLEALAARLETWLGTARAADGWAGLGVRVVAHTGEGVLGTLSGELRRLVALGPVADEVFTLLRVTPADRFTCSMSTWALASPRVPPPTVLETSLVSTGLAEVARLRSAPAVPAQRSGATAAASDPPGGVEAGRYELEAELGRGASGAVFAARDRVLDVRLALKLIDPAYLGEERLRRRVYKEVRLARMVTHPNVARVYDLTSTERGPAVSMELIEGATLESILEAGRPSIAFAVDLIRQVASGLAAIHAVGVVHRDLKPANIMIEASGRVVIVDFGVARGTAGPAVHNTSSGGIVGTPLYMAPEQLLGRPVDARADLFALGVLAYEVLVGVLPVTGDNIVQIAFLHAQGAYPDPCEVRPEIPYRLGAVVRACLQCEPAERCQSAEQVLDLLRSDELPARTPSELPRLLASATATSSEEAPTLAAG